MSNAQRKLQAGENNMTKQKDCKKGCKLCKKIDRMISSFKDTVVSCFYLIQIMAFYALAALGATRIIVVDWNIANRSWILIIFLIAFFAIWIWSIWIIDTITRKK